MLQKLDFLESKMPARLPRPESADRSRNLRLESRESSRKPGASITSRDIQRRFRRLGRTLLLAIGAASFFQGFARAADEADAAKLEFFERKVRPLLVANCFNCHSADNKAAGGLRVDDHKGLLQGGNRGPGVVPGDPEKSLLIQAIRQSDPKLRMPPEFKLEDEQIAILEQWVRDGAVWPALELPEDLGKWDANYEALRREHWAWQPLQNPAVPPVSRPDWVWDELDAFVLARQEQHQLTPVADADRLSWLRRVTFDLTGLPPTPAEIEAFLADATSEAHATVVDRLLASPAYGERWGRHWLDVARYGESTGSARNLPYPHAWRYRDYVIDAFNRDKPYDEFLREQIAGDLLPHSSPAEFDEHQIATGFLALGVKDVNQRFKVRFEMDNIDEQIDTVTRSILGLTVSCARCHDHKFDPIPTTDYYALAGIFQSSDHCAGLRNKMGGGGLDYYDNTLLLSLKSYPAPTTSTDAEELAAAQAALDKAKAEFERIRGTPEGAELAPNGRPKQQVARQKMNRAQAALNALSDPANLGAVTYGVREAKQIGDTEVRLRGEAEKLGPVVPRGFLTAVDVPGAPPVNREQSGRLELAHWLSSAENPLTSRVMVNRVWRHLFDRGLVSTVDNFGVTGDTPSHPELLDHLSQRFIRDGWSIKRLIRGVVLSHTYRLGTSQSPAELAIDPGNRWLWRHDPRRLEAEEIRDAMLAATGTLSSARPESSPVQSLRVIEMRNNGQESQAILRTAKDSQHRSVYLPLVRTLVPPSLEVFDFAEQGMVTGSRDTTTVPGQALYLLNDPLVRKQSLWYAEQLIAREDWDDAQRLREAYLRILGRAATPAEVDRAGQFLDDYAAISADVLADSFAEAASAEAPPESEVANVDTVPVKPANVPDPAANPDDVEQTEEVVVEEQILARDPRTAAWASFIQALFGSAEFRYLP
jgi:hypothetical protein